MPAAEEFALDKETVEGEKLALEEVESGKTTKQPRQRETVPRQPSFEAGQERGPWFGSVPSRGSLRARSSTCGRERRGSAARDGGPLRENPLEEQTERKESQDAPQCPSGGQGQGGVQRCPARFVDISSEQRVTFPAPWSSTAAATGRQGQEAELAGRGASDRQRAWLLQCLIFGVP